MPQDLRISLDSYSDRALRPSWIAFSRIVDLIFIRVPQNKKNYTLLCFMRSYFQSAATALAALSGVGRLRRAPPSSRRRTSSSQIPGGAIRQATIGFRCFHFSKSPEKPDTAALF